MFASFQKKLMQWIGPLKILGRLQITSNDTKPFCVESKTNSELFSVNNSGTVVIANSIFSPNSDFSIAGFRNDIKLMYSWNGFLAIGRSESDKIIFLTDNRGIWLKPTYPIGWGSSNSDSYSTKDIWMDRNGPNTLSFSGKDYCELQFNAKYSSSTAFQRASIKSYSQSLTVSDFTITTTLVIPKYSQLIGVTTRVSTAIGTTNGTTGYQVGDGTDIDLWGNIVGTSVGTTSDSRNFTALNALGPSGIDRTITITATGGNFDGTGVIDVCAFYLRVEAD